MDRVVGAIRKGHASGRSWSLAEEFCELRAKGVDSREAATLSFHIYAPDDVGDPGNPEAWSVSVRD
ncbi:hypothetical protein PUR49_23550 [Streptomyces sp. BE147]|uniref:hypothetical protein n=1 Tax=Streptomyces sp. BE147 TaxID=3002524 RepID=UPI002E770E21|nr:hypothetical protein [Streptomyces sp. BE147]MEE1739463.1 hypothetical protein [Streptomyces sp. BE147]